MAASEHLDLQASIPNPPETLKDEIRPNEIWPDKQFLEKALRSWLKDPDITITEFTSRIATKKGDNYSSDMFRVTVKCEQIQDPLTIIVKRIIRSGSGGGVISNSTMFVREEVMISAVLPEIQRVLKKVLPDMEPIGPGYIYSVPGVLMMEDLQPGGFRMAERRCGLDLNHCSLVIRTLARYHAAGVLLLEHKSIDFSLFQTNVFGEDCMRKPLENLFTGMLTTLTEELQYMKGLEKYSAKLSKLADQNFFKLLRSAAEDHEEDDFLVLSHGDLWVNNILFRYSSSGEPDGVRFVDLQLSFITSPSVDLLYFLTSSPNETVRTTCTDQLLKEYHETLCETMAALECSTRPPTIDKLKKDFDKRTHYGIFSAFHIMALVLAEPGQFVLDDVLDSGKPQNELFRSKAYIKALEWFLPLYERKGFL